MCVDFSFIRWKNSQDLMYNDTVILNIIELHTEKLLKWQILCVFHPIKTKSLLMHAQPYMQARSPSIHLKIFSFMLSHYLIKISETSLNY